MEITIPPDPLTETTNQLLSIFRQAVDEESRRAANEGIALEDHYRAVQTAAACQRPLPVSIFLQSDDAKTLRTWPKGQGSELRIQSRPPFRVLF